MDIHRTHNICHGYNCNIIISVITSRAFPNTSVDPDGDPDVAYSNVDDSVEGISFFFHTLVSCGCFKV